MGLLGNYEKIETLNGGLNIKSLFKWWRLSSLAAVNTKSLVLWMVKTFIIEQVVFRWSLDGSGCRDGLFGRGGR